jgi:hypothetical protein
MEPTLCTFVRTIFVGDLKILIQFETWTLTNTDSITVYCIGMSNMYSILYVQIQTVLQIRTVFVDDLKT